MSEPNDRNSDSADQYRGLEDLRPPWEKLMDRLKNTPWREMNDEERAEYQAARELEAQAEHDAIQSQHRQDRIARRIEQRIPRRWRERDIEHVELKEWTERTVAGDNAELTNLLLLGSVGVGKTGNACAVLRTLIEADHPGEINFFTFRSLLRGLRPSDNEAHPRLSLEDVVRAAVICIDDVGAEKSSEWVDEQFLEIIDERYNWMLPTIVTANLMPEDFAKRVGERVASRLNETSQLVLMSGPDRRRPPA